jgi:pentatricopeptide repeat protein
MTSSNPLFSLFVILLAQPEGIIPDEYTYGILMEHCARLNKVRLLFGFWGRFLKEGRQADTALFSPMLKCLCQEDRFGEASTIVHHKMPKQGCLPNMFSYTILIDGLCKKGQIEKAIDFIDDMISKGYQPDVMTCNIIINGLCKKGEIDEAMNILDDMISKGLQPDVRTYSIIISGLCRKDEIEKAIDLLDDMISKGYQPNIVIYNSLIDGLLKNGETKMAMVF